MNVPSTSPMAGSPYPADRHEVGVRALLDGERTGGRLAVVVRELAAGTEAPWRRLAVEDLVLVVLEGEVVLDLPDRSWTGVRLTALHVAPGVAHRFRATAPTRLLVVLAPAGAEQLLVHEDRLATEDPALLLALAQEHGVDLQPGLP